MYKFLIPLIVLFAVACNNHPQKARVKNPGSVTKSTQVAAVTATAHSMDTVPNVVIPANTLQVKTEGVPDSAENVFILQDCSANGDDMQPIVQKLSWKGLYITKDKGFIKDVKLNFTREHSELDNDGDTTGWRISPETEVKANYALFLSGPYFVNGLVKPAKAPTRIAPGQKFVFIYNKIPYTIYATGYYDKANEDVINYKLFLMANVKGHNFNQLLITEPNLGDEMKVESDEQVEIAFVGDIDGDNIPDFVIDEYGEFNGFSFLYLSKPAGNKAILKDVAMFGGTD